MPRLAVIGHPVAHSRSPAMQNAALAALGMGEEWGYEAIDVAPEEFEARVRGMADSGEFAGANVTVPHKEAALALAEGRTAVASEIGAANTLTFGPEGWIEADNTDAPGLLRALRGSPIGRRALVLGAGGAARAAIWALTRAGAVVEVGLEPFEVDIWNRTTRRAEDLSRALAPIGGFVVERPDLSRYGLIVNTTSVGLQGEDPFEELPLDPEELRERQVIDMVYVDGPSRLVRVAEEHGAVIVDGLEILVQQGALSLEIWTGRKPDLDVMRAAARA
jgi:shikimate dehydrogenase